MAHFGLRYFAQLRSKYKGVFWRVEIAKRDYSGPSEEMEFAGGSPLRQVYVDMARLYYVYEDPTYRDALELCLRPFARQIFKSGGSLHIRRAVSLYNDSRPLSFYEVGADFPQGWLITADGKDILTAGGDPIITTMSRDRIDSMWESEINVLGESTLEIVPAIRKVSVQVKNKMMANLVDQMCLYNLSRWSDPSGLLSLLSPTAIYLKGNKNHLDEVLFGPAYHVDQSAYTMVLQMQINTGYHIHSAMGIVSSQPIDRDYFTMATFMGSSVYGIERYNIGRNGAVVWSYYLDKVSQYGRQVTYVRTSSTTIEHTSFGTSPSFLSLVKSYASIVVNEAAGAYLYDRRSHPGTTSTFFEGVSIVSLSDYFMCQVKNSQLLIYRRDSITEQTLVKTIAINPLHCAHTLSEVAYAGSNHAVRIWDYRTNTLASVINGEAAGAPLRGLHYINGNLYIVRQGAIYKHIPNTK